MTTLSEAKVNEIKLLQKGQNSAMRYILGCNKETRIIDMLRNMKWLCMELLIKSRIFIFLYKIRKGLIDVKEDEIMELMKRREGRNVEQKYET